MKFGLSDLEAFGVVAELASIHNAADSVYLSRPALSRRIAKLEGVRNGPTIPMLEYVQPKATAVRVAPSALRRNFLARTRLRAFVRTRFFDQRVKLLRGG